QNALIAAVASRAKRIIVVLENGSPVTMPWLANVHGVLETWYPGVRGGQAIADVLFGDVNPSGKLPITFARQEADLPQQAIGGKALNVE
ncbi:glycoside hydrolase family 3 C-terminal domain-containing protein, partial [Arthrobacter sp. SIMBA_036]